MLTYAAALAGMTLTDATGTTRTLKFTEACRPWLVAVMTTAPGDLPSTATPVPHGWRLALVVSELTQATGTPVMRW
jgi:hypothetical protein